MAKIFNVSTIDGLESVGELDGAVNTIVSRIEDNKVLSRKVTIKMLADYVVGMIKDDKLITFEDLKNGVDYMDQILAKSQTNSFSSSVYSRSSEYAFAFNAATASQDEGDYWKTDDIVLNSDCMAHIHCQLVLGGTYNANSNDSVELQIRSASGSWASLCSEPRRSASGILELDYHARFQAGCVLRVATMKHASTTSTSSQDSFKIGSVVMLTEFSNDEPFTDSYVSRYLALGTNTNPKAPVATGNDRFVLENNGVVWFNGSYTQGSNLELSANYVGRPWHTYTVYAQMVMNDGTVVPLGNTESSIPYDPNSRTDVDFNGLYHYVEADSESRASVVVSADSALLDKNSKSQLDGQLNWAKAQFCELSDLAKTLGMGDAEDFVKPLSTVMTESPAVVFRYSPGTPSVNLKDSSGKNLNTDGRRFGVRRRNRAHLVVRTAEEGSPYYIGYGIEGGHAIDSGTRSYAFGFQRDGGIDLIAKHPTIDAAQLPLTTDVTAYGPSVGAADFTDLQNSLSNRIGNGAWGHVDFQISALPDNIQGIKVCPYTLDDYASNPIMLTDKTMSNPGEWRCDYTYSLVGVDFLTGGVTVDDSAFAYCQNLSAISIPHDVKMDGRYTFRMGSGYSSAAAAYDAMLLSVSPYYQSNSIYAINAISSSSGKVYYKINTPIPVGSILSTVFFGDEEELDSQNPQNKVELVNQGKVLLNTFVNCKNLLSANIQATDALALSGTFINCESITSIVIPHGCTTIGAKTFYGAHSLRRISIPTTVTYVERDCATSSYFHIKRTSTASWLNKYANASNTTAATIRSNTLKNWSTLSSVNGNRGMSSIYDDEEPSDNGQYEMDIRLSSDLPEYMTGQEINMDKVAKEISSTVEALNRQSKYSSFTGIEWFPLVHHYPLGSKYVSEYLPPRGRLFYITDVNGNKINRNGGKLVYNSMAVMGTSTVYNIDDEISGKNPASKKNQDFIKGKWYTRESGKGWRDAMIEAGVTDFNKDFLTDTESLKETNLYKAYKF